MSEPTNKQLSRRDALKLLGAAAGASVLANLPSKWSTPQSVAGVLPAHAQTSALGCPELGWSGTVIWQEGAQDAVGFRLVIPVPGGFTVGPGSTPELITGTSWVEGEFQQTITVPTGNLIEGTWIATVANLSPDTFKVHFELSGACASEGGFDLEGKSLKEIAHFDVDGCKVSCA